MELKLALELVLRCAEAHLKTEAENGPFDGEREAVAVIKGNLFLCAAAPKLRDACYHMWTEMEFLKAKEAPADSRAAVALRVLNEAIIEAERKE